MSYGLRYVAHLARDDDRRLTVCGAPWQGWQQPGDAYAEPPWQEPVPHRTVIHQCQACLHGALRR